MKLNYVHHIFFIDDCSRSFECDIIKLVFKIKTTFMKYYMMEDFMERIAIIGMGISGSAVLTAYAKELAKKQYHNVKIDCYDIPESFGRGLPFRDDSSLALVNTRTTDITYDYEQRGEYEDWLKYESHNEGEITEYTSRALFGEYLKERTMQQVQSLDATIHYETVEDINWLANSNQWELINDSNQVRKYDRVHLCCGTLPVHDAYHLNGYPKYISNPYPLHSLTNEISKPDRVVVIGTSLTAVDIIKYLTKDRHVESVYAFSRQNLFPIVGIDNFGDLMMTHITLANVKATMEPNNPILHFYSLDQLIQREFDNIGIRFEDVCQIVLQPGTKGMRDSINHSELMAKTERVATATTRILNQYWQYMPESDRTFFLDKYQEPFNLVKGKLPMKSAQALIEEEDSGRLIILKDVEDIKYDDVSKNYIVMNEAKEELIRADWIINATGINLKLEGDLSDYPLIHSLLNKRYITPDSAGGLSINVTTQSVISPSWGELTSLHAHGMLVSGAVYMNNSTYNIQSLAHQLVKSVVNNY